MYSADAAVSNTENSSFLEIKLTSLSLAASV
jgi:hypothetical protein